MYKERFITTELKLKSLLMTCLCTGYKVLYKTSDIKVPIVNNMMCLMSTKLDAIRNTTNYETLISCTSLIL